MGSYKKSIFNHLKKNHRMKNVIETFQIFQHPTTLSTSRLLLS